MGVQRESELKCPECHFRTLEVMPEDACLYFHECANCHT